MMCSTRALDLAVHPVVVIADDAAGAVTTGRVDVGDAAVASVAEDHTPLGEEVCDGVAGDHDIVRLPANVCLR